MKILGWILAGTMALVSLIVLAGFALPATRHAQADRVFQAAPDRLRAILLDRASQPNWRRELASVTLVSPTRWIETTRRGEVITFDLMRQESSLIEMRFSSSYGYHGKWQGRLVASFSGGTHIFVTEEATTSSPFGRILSRLFFNPEAFATAYLDALEGEAQRRYSREMP